MVDLHDLAAAYALDALDADERADFEDHMATCDRCQLEVGRLSEGTLSLAELSAQTPPPHLKARLMETIETVAAREEPAVVPFRPRRWQWAFAAAAALAVVFAGLLVSTNSRLDQAETIAAIYEAADSVSIALDSEVGAAEFTYSIDLGLGVFVDLGLAEPPGNRVYELWLVDSAGPVPAGTFRPQEDRLIVTDVVPDLILAMTEEPAGGSETPTGDLLFTADL